jgi:hypothetical protein
METLSNTLLQYIDTFLASEDKVNFKCTNTTLYQHLRMQPWRQHQGHFISAKRYRGCFKKLNSNAAGTLFHGHQLQIHLVDLDVRTYLNVSNHCATCLHRLPADALLFPSIFSVYDEPELVVEQGHDCAFAPKRIQRVPTKDSPTSTYSIHPKERPPSVYVIELYHYHFPPKSDDDEQKEHAYWTKKIVFACCVECVLEVENRVRQSVTPYFIFSYCIDGVRPLSKKVLDDRLHAIMLDCRLMISQPISFNLNMYHNGILAGITIKHVHDIEADLSDSLELRFPACLLATGKEPHYRHQAHTLKKEFYHWALLIHPNPFKDPNHPRNHLDISSVYLNRQNLSILNKSFKSTILPPPSPSAILQATHELELLPYIPIYLHELNEEGQDQLFSYTFTVRYGFLSTPKKWHTSININEGNTYLSVRDWRNLCTAVARFFNITRGFQYLSPQNKLDNDTYIHTKQVIGTMTVHLFQGEFGGHFVTEEDLPTSPFTQDELLSDEVLSDIDSDY